MAIAKVEAPYFDTAVSWAGNDGARIAADVETEHWEVMAVESEEMLSIKVSQIQ